MVKYFLFCLFLAVSTAVDRSNFKTCGQLSFCRRQRAVKEGSSLYAANLSDVFQSKEDGVVIGLINKKNDVKFVLQLLPLQHGILRVLMDEKTPLYKRFKEPFSVLEDNLKLDIFEASKSSTHLEIKWGEVKAVLRAEPMLLEVYRGQTLVVTLNARQMLKYEHYRTRPQAHEEGEEAQAEAPEGEQISADVSNDEETDTEGMWEESFKGHTDTKPRGPSSIGVDIAFVGVKHVYGIPEHADNFALKDTEETDPYRLYNLDVFEYELYNPMALYASIPVMLGHGSQGTVGVFWHNAAETWVDIKHLPASDVVSSITGFFSSDEAKSTTQVSSHWMSEAGVIDVFIMTGPTPAKVFHQYGLITGTTNLPPMFSLAYHQCRWNYNDQEDVRDVHNNFDVHHIPMDTIWLDIEHTDGKRYFTWDSRKFPNPLEMNNELSARGRKLVTIIDPHIKRDSNYFFYQENKDLDNYIKTRDGQEFDGWCWPGSSSYLDMTKPEARDHYIKTFALDKYQGSTLDTFTWNDMNEPSVFNGPEITMQKDYLHPGLNVEHREIHNVNGMLFHASTYAGHLYRSEGKLRPFVLTRSGFAGSQRSTAIWTGDNLAEWGHLKISVPMLLSLSVTGLSHAGSDIGGFFGNPEPQLLTRWYQAAAYTPFFRAHAHLDSKRREPWLFEPEVTSLIRRAIIDHYRILPYFYTLFWENYRTGMPVMRPLWVEFPTDELTFSLEHQYMLGGALLVAPVLDKDKTEVDIYFPTGNWFDTADNTVVTGPQALNVAAPQDKVPVYQRGGTIIPRKERVRRSSKMMKNDPYTLIIALDENQSARGEIYIDDEHTMDYKDGAFIHLSLSMANNKLASRHLHSSSYVTDSWLERIVILGLSEKPRSVKLVTGEGSTSLEGSYSGAEGTRASRLILRKPGVNMGTEFSVEIS